MVRGIAELLQDDRAISKEGEFVPVTRYLFDEREKEKYMGFVNYYGSHREDLKKVGHDDPREHYRVREEGQARLKEGFFGIMGDYFKKISAEFPNFFAGYGEEGEILCESVRYHFFDAEKSGMGDSMTITSWFKCSGEGISSRSNFKYGDTLSPRDSVRNGVVFDIFGRVYSGLDSRTQNHAPISKSGSFIYFAPLSLAIPFMQSTQEIIGAIGKDRMEELVGFKSDHLDSVTWDPNDRQKRVTESLEKVYFSELQKTFSKVGFAGDQRNLI